MAGWQYQCNNATASCMDIFFIVEDTDTQLAIPRQYKLLHIDNQQQKHLFITIYSLYLYFLSIAYNAIQELSIEYCVSNTSS